MPRPSRDRIGADLDVPVAVHAEVRLAPAPDLIELGAIFDGPSARFFLTGRRCRAAVVASWSSGANRSGRYRSRGEHRDLLGSLRPAPHGCHPSVTQKGGRRSRARGRPGCSPRPRRGMARPSPAPRRFRKAPYVGPSPRTESGRRSRGIFMRPLTSAGENAVQNLAQRYGVSVDAVRTLLSAVAAGGGSMAQFYHAGSRRWRPVDARRHDHGRGHVQQRAAGHGQRTLLGALVAAQQPAGLCARSAELELGGFMASGNDWWPSELGQPELERRTERRALRLLPERATPRHLAQRPDHRLRHARPQHRRRAAAAGRHSGSLSFSSQFGTFTVESLPTVVGGAQAPERATEPGSSSRSSPRSSSPQQPPSSNPPVHRRRSLLRTLPSPRVARRNRTTRFSTRSNASAPFIRRASSPIRSSRRRRPSSCRDSELRTRR